MWGKHGSVTCGESMGVRHVGKAWVCEPCLSSSREEDAVEHRRVRELSAVATRKQAECQLALIDHRREDEARRTNGAPPMPRGLYMLVEGAGWLDGRCGRPLLRSDSPTHLISTTLERCRLALERCRLAPLTPRLLCSPHCDLASCLLLEALQTLLLILAHHIAKLSGCRLGERSGRRGFWSF